MYAMFTELTCKKWFGGCEVFNLMPPMYNFCSGIITTSKINVDKITYNIFIIHFPLNQLVVSVNSVLTNMA